MANEQSNGNEIMAQAVAEAARVTILVMAAIRAERTTECSTQTRLIHNETINIQLGNRKQI